MKIFSTIIFGLICSFGFAQNSNDLSVSVTLNNQPLKEIFHQIEIQTNYQFSYNSTLVNSDSLITYSSSNSVKKIIADLFDKRIKAKIIGNHIVLVSNKKDQNNYENAIRFTGVILNAENQKPLKNASIYEISSRKSVTSDSLGRFTFIFDKGTSKNFAIAKINFNDTVISVDLQKKKRVQIVLQPIISSLTVESKTTTSINETSAVAEILTPKMSQITFENLEKIQEKRIGQVSIIPTIGTNMEASGIIDNNLSLNVFGGYNGGVNGLEIGGLFNILTRNMHGVQIGGLSNFVQGYSKGVQIGGINNFLAKEMIGVQVGGISNIVIGKVIGVQIGGIQNHIAKSMRGLQIGGILNWAQDSINGMQIAGISNIAHGEVGGVQLAGIHNLSTKNISGAQICGISNQAIKDMSGIQIGLINYAQNNRGFQLGLINVAENASGVALGLFNYVQNGYHPLELFGNEVLYTNVAFKSGVDHFYTMFTGGVRPNDPQIFGLGFGIGSRVNTWKWLSFSFDLTGTFINEKELNTQYTWELNLLNRLDVTMDFNIKKFTIFAGPAINAHVSQMGYESTGTFTTDIARDPFYTASDDQTQIQFWYGAKAGIRYNF